MFILAGLYFVALAVLNESSIYVILASILCFSSAGLAVKKSWFFSIPWRVASAGVVLVLTVSQIISVVISPAVSSITVASELLNGALFILFLGVVLSSAKDIMKKAPKEEEEEKKESRKLTYEV